MTEEKKENNTPERNKRKVDDINNNNNQTSEDSHPANKCDPRLGNLTDRVKAAREKQEAQSTGDGMTLRRPARLPIRRRLFPSTPQELEKAAQQLREEVAAMKIDIKERYEILERISGGEFDTDDEEFNLPKKRIKNERPQPLASDNNEIIEASLNLSTDITSHCRDSAKSELPDDLERDGGGRGGFAGLAI